MVRSVFFDASELETKTCTINFGLYSTFCIVFNKNAQVPVDRKFKLQKNRAIIRMKNPIARRSTREYQREVHEKRGGGGGFAYLEARD